MIVVRVELHSAISGEVTELARMEIHNRGDGSTQLGNYAGYTLVGRSSQDLDRSHRRLTWKRQAKVDGHKRLRLHVWHLVAKMLSGMGYGAPDAR